MKPTEFNEWLTVYQAAFPSVGKWLHKLDRDTQQKQLKTWRATLSPVSLEAAKAITHQMATGERDPVGPWDNDREQTAVVIKRAAATLGVGQRRTEQTNKRALATRIIQSGRRAGRSDPEIVERLKQAGVEWSDA